MDDGRSYWDDEDFLDAVLDFSVKYKGKSLYTGNASCPPPRKKAKQTLPHSKPMTTSLKTLDGKSLYTRNASCQPPRKKAKQPLSHSKPMTASLKTLDGYHKPELSMTDDRHTEWSDEWDQDFLYEVIKFCERDYKDVIKVKGSQDDDADDVLYTGSTLRPGPGKAEPLSQFKATGSLKTLAGNHSQVIKVKCSQDDDADDVLCTGNTLRLGPGKAEPLSQFKATGSLKPLAGNHNQGSVSNAGTSGCVI